MGVITVVEKTKQGELLLRYHVERRIIKDEKGEKRVIKIAVLKSIQLSDGTRIRKNDDPEKFNELVSRYALLTEFIPRVVESIRTDKKKALQQ